MEEKDTHQSNQSQNIEYPNNDQLIVTYDDSDGDIPTLVVMRYDGVYHHCLNLVQGEEARSIYKRLITWIKPKLKD